MCMDIPVYLIGMDIPMYLMGMDIPVCLMCMDIFFDFMYTFRV